MIHHPLVAPLSRNDMPATSGMPPTTTTTTTSAVPKLPPMSLAFKPVTLKKPPASAGGSGGKSSGRQVLRATYAGPPQERDAEAEQVPSARGGRRERSRSAPGRLERECDEEPRERLVLVPRHTMDVEASLRGAEREAGVQRAMLRHAQAQAGRAACDEFVQLLRLCMQGERTELGEHLVLTHLLHMPSSEFVALLAALLDEAAAAAALTAAASASVAVSPTPGAPAWPAGVTTGTTGVAASEMQRRCLIAANLLKKFLQPGLGFYSLQDRELMQRLRGVEMRLERAGHTRLVASLQALTEKGARLTQAGPARIPVPPKLRDPLEDVPPHLLAAQLVLMHHADFVRVRTVEWLYRIQAAAGSALGGSSGSGSGSSSGGGGGGGGGGEDESSQVEGQVGAIREAAERLQLWAASQVLGSPKAKQRVARLTRLVELAARLRELHDEHGARVLALALLAPALQRLQHTWKALPSRSRQLWNSLLARAPDPLEVSGPCVPYLPDLLARLSALARAPASTLLDRVTMLGRALAHLQQLQACRYEQLLPHALPPLQQYLREAPRLARHELEQYSRYCEPDNEHKKEIEQLVQSIQELQVSAGGPPPASLAGLVDRLLELPGVEVREVLVRAQQAGRPSQQRRKLSLFGGKSGGGGGSGGGSALALALNRHRLDFASGGAEPPTAYATLHERFALLNQGKDEVRLSLAAYFTRGSGRLTLLPSEVTLRREQALDVELEAIVTQEGEARGCVIISATSQVPPPYVLPFRFRVAPLLPRSGLYTPDQLQAPDARLVGQGAAGSVYRVRLPVPPPAGPLREVAVKRFHVTELSEQDLKEFRTEVQLLHKLRHPFVVELIGACLEFPHLAVLMEFMPLGSLASVLRSPQLELPWPLRLRFALDAARGIAFLHHFNVLHRDLKSDNLLVSSLDPADPVTCKVTDFSLSRELRDPRLKMTLYTGTPQWKAPEILDGAPPSRMSDMYSFGVVMWEIAARLVPFSELRFGHQIEEAVRRGQRPALPPGTWMPEEYGQLMRLCWHQRPEQRPSFDDCVSLLRFCQIRCNWCPSRADTTEFEALAPSDSLQTTEGE